MHILASNLRTSTGRQRAEEHTSPHKANYPNPGRTRHPPGTKDMLRVLSLQHVSKVNQLAQRGTRKKLEQ